MYGFEVLDSQIIARVGRPKRPSCCPRCHSNHINKHRSGKPRRTLHTGSAGRIVNAEVHLHRYRCTFTEPLAGIVRWQPRTEHSCGNGRHQENCFSSGLELPELSSWLGTCNALAHLSWEDAEVLFPRLSPLAVQGKRVNEDLGSLSTLLFGLDEHRIRAQLGHIIQELEPDDRSAFETFLERFIRRK